MSNREFEIGDNLGCFLVILVIALGSVLIAIFGK